jgi:hypothetical protein
MSERLLSWTNISLQWPMFDPWLVHVRTGWKKWYRGMNYPECYDYTSVNSDAKIVPEIRPLSPPSTSKKKLNSMVWVCERNIPTELSLLVGEVIANFSGYRVPRGQRDRFLRPWSSRQEPLLFYQVAPQLYSRGWVDPVPDPLLLFLVVPGIEPGPPGL